MNRVLHSFWGQFERQTGPIGMPRGTGASNHRLPDYSVGIELNQTVRVQCVTARPLGQVSFEYW